MREHDSRAAIWSSGGFAYDEISRQIASALDHCVERLDPSPGERILDVATGTGWTARLLAARGATVNGVDVAADLIAVAKRLGQMQGPVIEYESGDAEQLPFADASFDAVVSTFGVMFTSRPDAAAGELARVCRKGGRLALATWPPDNNVFEMFRILQPYMSPSRASPPSPFAWGRRERMDELLGSTFALRFEEGETIYHARDGEAAWQAFISGYGPIKALAASLDDGRRKDLKRDFAAFHDTFAAPLGISVPRRYLLTLGTRR